MKVLYRLIAIIVIIYTAYVTNLCGQTKSIAETTQTEEVNKVAKPLKEIRIMELQPQPILKNGKCVVIKENYDLDGKNLVLEEGKTLEFNRGSFRNGYVTGNNTKIKGKTKAIFDNIRIRGSWIVEYVTTDMFRDLSYEQSLQDVLALTAPQVTNNVVIKEYGYKYVVKVTSVDMVAAPLKLKSNTDLQLDGRIQLKPTNLFQYVIMLIHECSNVKIHGKGSITGDRTKHDYNIDEEHKAWKTHEWGHGLKIAQSKDIEICGITVEDCIGDSYNIGNNSQRILLDGVVAKGSRRQGVTIAVASNVTIKNSHFNNIGRENGTSSGAAIDIEPDNTECEIENIKIEGCDICNCIQGVISWSHGYANSWEENIKGEKIQLSEKRHYVNLIIRDCRVEGTEHAFSLYGWDMAMIRKCKVTNSLYFAGCSSNTIFEDNDISVGYFMKDGSIISNGIIKDNKINAKNKIAIRLENSKFENNRYTRSSCVEVVN